MKKSKEKMRREVGTGQREDRVLADLHLHGSYKQARKKLRDTEFWSHD